MSGAPPQRARRPSSLWWLALALAAVTLAFGWHVALLLRTRTAARGADGDVASYGFALTPLTIPHGSLVASGMSRDGLRALVEPDVWSVADLARADAARRGRWLVPGDRVIGVTIGGQTRAYPLRFLVWHEVVNDVVGGSPILVTYHALTDCAAAFRRDGSDPPPVFGVSGLLWNSGLLMYDRRPRPSLWSPLLGRAVSGPLARDHATLTRLAVTVCTWRDWLALHPGTTVLAPEPAMAAEYARDPYSSYFGSDLLRFPVEPSMPFAGLREKTPVLIAVEPTGGYLAIPFPTVAERAGDDGLALIQSGAVRLRLRYERRPPTVVVVENPTSAPVLYALAFAWYAAHPDDTEWLLPNPSTD